MKNPERHVAVYLRVSSDRQSTASQVPDLERWLSAYASGESVVWYSDTSNDHIAMDRRDWKRLEREIREGRVSKLLVWKLDRLGRSARRLLELFEELRQRGVGFLSLKESIDLETPAGRLMVTILAALAEYDLEVSSMRIRAGKARRRERGEKQRSRRGERRKVTPEMIARIIEMRRQGWKTGRIAEAVGLSTGHLRRLLREEIPPDSEAPPSSQTPVRRKARHRKVSAGDIRVLRNLLARDLPRTTIARTLGISRKHLYDLIRMYGGG